MPFLCRTFLFLILLAAAASPSALKAQLPSAGRDSAVTRLTTGQQIRISAEGLGRLVGRAGVATGDTLDFAQDDMVRRIPIPAIDTLWTMGRATSTGIVIGAVVGSAFGLLAAAYGAAACEYDCSSTGLEYIGVAVVGGAAGVGLGALIGSAFPKWKRKYP